MNKKNLILLGAAGESERINAARYLHLRNKSLDTISSGGIFAGKTPENEILNGEDLDHDIDAEISASLAEEVK